MLDETISRKYGTGLYLETVKIYGDFAIYTMCMVGNVGFECVVVDGVFSYFFSNP